MTRILTLSLVGILSSIAAGGEPNAQPDCAAPNATKFVPADGPTTAGLTDASNWTNGIPDANSLACFPPDAAELSASWPGVSRILEPPGTVEGDLAAANASLPNPPNPTDIGGCCLGSICIDSDYFDCMILDGFFHPGVFCSGFNPCLAGACCVGDSACLDDEDLGGVPMDEEICNIEFGNYIGGAVCSESDPCQRFRLPEGFETIEVTPGTVNFGHFVPRLSNCGEIVFTIKMGSSWADAEIFLYDNGRLTRLTDNTDRDVGAEINDWGAVIWSRGIGDAGITQIMQFDDGQETLFFNSPEGRSSPNGPINNLGHIAYDLNHTGSCPRIDDLFFYNGGTTRVIIEDGLSNQSPAINDHGQITWGRTVFDCPPTVFWTSDIMLYSNGETTIAPTSLTQRQVPRINNLGQIVWSGVHPDGDRGAVEFR